MKPSLSKTVLSLVVTIVLVSGCAANDPNQRAKTGAAIGAIAGAVLGHQADHDQGRFIGAAIGAIAGAAVGDYMDQQQRDLERDLYAETSSQAIEIQRLQDETLKISLSNEASFDLNNDEVKAAFYPTLNKIATTLNQYDRTMLHIIGHTDSSGSAEYNLDLSRRRAGNVANYIAALGVNRGRLIVDGQGEFHPRAPNDTAANRRMNRRVEIYIKAVTDGNENQALQKPYV